MHSSWIGSSWAFKWQAVISALGVLGNKHVLAGLPNLPPLRDNNGLMDPNRPLRNYSIAGMWSSFVAQHACFTAAALCSCKHPAGGALVDYGGSASVGQSEWAICKSSILIGRTFSVKHTQSYFTTLSENHDRWRAMCLSSTTIDYTTLKWSVDNRTGGGYRTWSQTPKL